MRSRTFSPPRIPVSQSCTRATFTALSPRSWAALGARPRARRPGHADQNVEEVQQLFVPEVPLEETRHQKSRECRGHSEAQPGGQPARAAPPGEAGRPGAHEPRVQKREGGEP